MTIDLSSGDIIGAITSLDTGHFLALVGFVGVFTLGSFFTAFRSLRRARLIEDVPTSKIRSAHQGYVELEGHAMPHPLHGTQKSPLEGRDCVWWRYEIEQRRSNGKGQHRWVTVEKRMSKSSFVVEDDTGSCVIRPDGALARIDLSRTWHGSSRRPVAGAVGASSMLGHYRYTEAVILAGERLYALGHFATKRDEETGATAHELGKPSDGSPFLLSTQSQGHLMASLRSGASSAFMAFMAGGAGMVWLLAVRGVF